MGFRYGQNYKPVHIYDEIQHIDIEAYKYTLKLQIYIYPIACVQTSPLLQKKSGEETSVNRRR